jgi:hypothetical protein
LQNARLVEDFESNATADFAPHQPLIDNEGANASLARHDSLYDVPEGFRAN